jgi:hypothetical protein
VPAFIAAGWIKLVSVLVPRWCPAAAMRRTDRLHAGIQFPISRCYVAWSHLVYRRVDLKPAKRASILVVWVLDRHGAAVAGLTPGTPSKFIGWSGPASLG